MERPGFRGRARTRLILLILCAVAATWSVVVAASGGFVLTLGSFRVLSSREPETALIISVLSGVSGWILSSADERRRVMKAVAAGLHGLRSALLGAAESTLPVRLAARIPARAAPGMTVVVATVVVAVGVLKGAPYVGGSDVYGYVSQAELWAAGRLQVPQPLASDFDWPFAADTLAPLGYRPSLDRTAVVPVYAPGYPIVMAIFRNLGGRDAVFYVVPLLGGVAVLATYLMGVSLGGSLVGVAAALLLATSPSFLFQLMLPMSDVPVTAWWALSLGFALRESRSAALVSGLAAGAAILTRPNLVPLAIVPGLLLLAPAMRAQSFHGSQARRVLLFAGGAVPSCLLIGFLNAKFFGSAVSAGYGPLEALYKWSYLVPNLQRYPYWLLRTETPIVLLVFLAPFLIHRLNRGKVAALRPRTVSMAWLAFIALIFLAYLFHFPNNSWFWLRYVLPAFPALFVLTCVGVVALLTRFDRGIRVVWTAIVVATVASYGVAFAAADGVFNFKDGERKSQAIGRHIAARFPERAAFISLQHSGSIRYYSGRLTLRYDLIPPEALNTVIEDLRRRDYHPYVLLEEWEEPSFRNRFAPYSDAGRLDWPEAVRLDHSTRVRIYDPADRDRPPSGRNPTEIVR